MAKKIPLTSDDSLTGKSAVKAAVPPHSKKSKSRKNSPSVAAAMTSTAVKPIKKKARRVAHEEMFKDSDYMHEQLDRLIFALEAFREGDISVRLSKERNDKFADLAEAYNTMV